MEPSQFDELTKALATATSRRHALKTIAATIGGLLGLSSIGTAFANCKPNGIGCNTNTQCCSGGCCHGTCTNLSSNPSNCGSCGHTCGTNQICQNSQCVTPCTANEGTCSTNTDCCSGNCSNGICCGSGQVGLCNGSCATPCDNPNGACSDGSFCAPDNGASYCGGVLESNPICKSDCDCPRGYFCGTDIGTCEFVS